MDYEKKYNEALNLAKSYYEKEDGGANQFLDTIFPELAESEDEKIRKAIVLGIKRCADAGSIFGTVINNEGVNYHDVLAWLEKQKEQKPAEKQDYSGLNDLERAIHRGFLAAGVKNVPVGIIKETAKECLTQMNPAEWSEEDKRMVTGICANLTKYCTQYCNKQSEPSVTQYDFAGKKRKEIKEQCDWLESLRPDSYKNCNSRWKPSEEQISALQLSIEECERDHYYQQQEDLVSLMEDLKKLM